MTRREERKERSANGLGAKANALCWGVLGGVWWGCCDRLIGCIVIICGGCSLLFFDIMVMRLGCTLYIFSWWIF